MKYRILCLIAMLPISLSYVDTALEREPSEYSVLSDLVTANDMTPHDEAIKAILEASKRYDIDSRELTAIAIVESSFSHNSRMIANTNGTHDIGLFQINTVNHDVCKEYNLYDVKDNALCAAKLLARLKVMRRDYVGAYHSKTPEKKMKYIQKITQVLNKVNRYDSNDITEEL